MSTTADCDPATVATSDGVFDQANAAHLSAADTSHWWFRGKARAVDAALERWATADGWLIDVGAGSGGVTSMLAWDARSRLALEGSRFLVTQAARRGLLASQGNVFQLPIRDGAAAAVCLLDVIEHLPDPIGALSEACRATSPNGVVVVTVPAHPWLWSAADEALGHYRRYRRAQLAAQLSSAGLEPLWASHVFSWCVPPVWIARKVRSPGGAELGIGPASNVVERIADVMNSLERRLLTRARIPLGTSVMAVARPHGGERRMSSR